ncbi:PD-(D/E)XK nuclease family protein [Flavobacterium agrisoli]|uniref:PD-(D/E)XK nuclease family protein n=1 Tax=Flavobacterium agrisoli TaxID=2793066 RepID=A0A934UJP5_9FLAO|nr:PD-(D/E)XK nuclease family protein [Flavobacterium agrisoli]MBK0369779.1 PD-(D/E)XK nuclease family protein [Flavobacterium agrisoli]
MSNNRFLDKIAKTILELHADKLADLVVVLPNKRAKVFLMEALSLQIQSNILAPKIISVEDFVQEVATIRAIDSIELLFEFFQVYLQITPIERQETFESFANWGKMLLQDFNEIDRYLLNPQHILSYLKDIEDIKRWGVTVENKTQLLENYIDFWKLLPLYYDQLYEHLKSNNVGYQGLIYREAVGNLKQFTEKLGQKYFLFAGFNALNAAEEKIIQHLIGLQKASIYWDIDQVFLNDPQHDASLFINRFKSKWKQYKTHPFEWIMNDFAQPKNIQVIGTPKTIGQAKIVGSIVKERIAEFGVATLKKTAIVLGDEHLLLPVLHSLPNSVEKLNITMGYSSKNNPVQILVNKFFKMHTNAMARDNASYLFYYKDVLDVLNHPLVAPYAQAQTLVDFINKNNYTFITQRKITELYTGSSEMFILLFKKWDADCVAVLQSISDLLLQIKEKLSNDSKDDVILKTFVYSVFKVINKLTTYFSKYQVINKIDTLYTIYKQVIELAEVSFEGEPLDGLQIMGVLESRVLDFDTVIITSMNEGKFPAGKSQNSFIPYDVKREYDLPTFKEKDAIYTYHFYHLLQRASNVYLLYNTESDGIDAGEKSRFITQLEVEKQPNHALKTTFLYPNLPEEASSPMVISKTSKVMERLFEIAKKGFSPSSLTTYIRNPIQFYLQRILQIKEVDEVEENIALNTLGTIIHESLKVLFEPFIGQILTEKAIQQCFSLLEKEVLEQFKLVYKEGEINKGKNLLAFEVAKRNITNFLNLELKSIRDGEMIKIIALEQTYERELLHPDLPFPVIIKGNVDRIEERNGKLRIVDYKTGKVEKRNMVLKSWEGLTEDIKNEKIIQVLAYAFMYQELANGMPIEAGIISFKNLKAGFLPFEFKPDKASESIITSFIIEEYTQQIAILLKEILDEKTPFEEKI